MKAIKQKQAELEEQVKTIKTSTAKMKTSVEAIQETQTLQGTEINRHETELKEVFRRLEEVESNRAINNLESDTPAAATYANRLFSGNNQLQTIVRTQVNEQSEIEKLKLNLVISGIAESYNDDEDKAKVIQLITEELELTADIRMTERLGKLRVPKEGEDPLPPRLLKLCFVTQRSRKEVLAKATTLRNSNDEHIKSLVYIRPDLTKLQLEQSKNLRDLLRKIRAENPTKTYKITRNEIKEVTPVAATPQTPDGTLPAATPPVEQPLADPAPETHNA